MVVVNCVTRWFVFVLTLVLWTGCAPSGGSSTSTPTPSASTQDQVTDPEFSITVGEQSKKWKSSELLKHPALREITVPNESAYEGQTKSYQAVPLALLFEGFQIPDGQTLEYQTTDGFISSFKPERLLQTSEDGAVAYLAVEDPNYPWPNFRNRNYGPGPFYLIWERPEASNIGREEWPYKLTGFNDRPDLDTRYPKLPPDAALSVDHPVRNGYKLYLRNCFPCHQINGEGQASQGPDLNYPMSPTEYLVEGMIQKLVRDPQSMRSWGAGKMLPFSQEDISDEELDHIVLYLKHKAETRP